MASYFQDDRFQNKLLGHVVRDRLLLKEVGKFLEADDFRPTREGEREQWARWIISGIALDYWKKYRQPVNGLLRSEVLNYIEKNRVGERQRKALLNYIRVVKKQTLEAGNVLVERVGEFKKEMARRDALDTLTQLQADGELTDELMMETCRTVLDVMTMEDQRPTDFLKDEEADMRIQRRMKAQRNRPPLFFIDPLDRLVVGCKRKELGVILAPYKRGKSMMLIHMALAFTVQRLNVLHVTAEDPKATVEDRFDAAMASLPIKKLTEKQDVFLTRFRRLRRILRGRLFVADATEGQCKLSWLEERLQELREQGTMIDVLIVDYDDEIEPPQRSKERRLEFAAIYKGLRRLAARWDMVVWTAAQTKRGTEEKKTIRGDDAAEDISKLRKVTMALSIGNGEDVHPRGLYLYVAAHRNDQKHVGTYIVHDQDKSVFYDRPSTMRLLAKLRRRRVS